MSSVYSLDETRLRRNLRRRQQRADRRGRPWDADTIDYLLAAAETIAHARVQAVQRDFKAARKILRELWPVTGYMRRPPGLGFIGCTLDDAIDSLLTCPLGSVDHCDADHCVHAWVYETHRYGGSH
jgi:hypothetical protein